MGKGAEVFVHVRKQLMDHLSFTGPRTIASVSPVGFDEALRKDDDHRTDDLISHRRFEGPNDWAGVGVARICEAVQVVKDRIRCRSRVVARREIDVEEQGQARDRAHELHGHEPRRGPHGKARLCDGRDDGLPGIHRRFRRHLGAGLRWLVRGGLAGLIHDELRRDNALALHRLGAAALCRTLRSTRGARGGQGLAGRFGCTGGGERLRRLATGCEERQRVEPIY
jgi:hypothetical protein